MDPQLFGRNPFVAICGECIVYSLRDDSWTLVEAFFSNSAVNGTAACLQSELQCRNFEGLLGKSSQLLKFKADRFI